MITLKEIVKNNIAKFSHACSGVLYYTVECENGIYQFPVDMNNKEDVGTTTFVNEYKAITLMRYIRKSMENETLFKIK